MRLLLRCKRELGGLAIDSELMVAEAVLVGN